MTKTSGNVGKREISMQIEGNNAQMAMSTQQERLSQPSEIVKLLLALAERRDASVSSEKLQIYVEDLLEFDLRDVHKACAKIGQAERADGETAFPTMGKLLAGVKEAARLRGLAELRIVYRPEVAVALLRNAEIKRLVDSGATKEMLLDVEAKSLIGQLEEKCGMN